MPVGVPPAQNHCTFQWYHYEQVTGSCFLFMYKPTPVTDSLNIPLFARKSPSSSCSLFCFVYWEEHIGFISPLPCHTTREVSLAEQGADVTASSRPWPRWTPPTTSLELRRCRRPRAAGTALPPHKTTLPPGFSRAHQQEINEPF